MPTDPHAPRAGESAPDSALPPIEQWGDRALRPTATEIMDDALREFDRRLSAAIALPAPSVAAAPLDAMAERLWRRTTLVRRSDAREALEYTLTGLLPGPERDAILARLHPQSSPVRGTSTYTGNQSNHGGGHGG